MLGCTCLYCNNDKRRVWFQRQFVKENGTRQCIHGYRTGDRRSATATRTTTTRIASTSKRPCFANQDSSKPPASVGNPVQIPPAFARGLGVRASFLVARRGPSRLFGRLCSPFFLFAIEAESSALGTGIRRNCISARGAFASGQRQAPTPQQLPAKVWTMPREVPRRTPVDGKSRNRLLVWCAAYFSKVRQNVGGLSRFSPRHGVQALFRQVEGR